MLIREILLIIPPRSNREVPEHPDYRRYRGLTRIERMFGKLRRIAPATTRPAFPPKARHTRCRTPKAEI